MLEVINMPIRKRCVFCNQWYKPDPRTVGQQRTCGQGICQGKRKALTDQAFRVRYPTYDKTRRVKVNQWAAAYPTYFRNYRKTHPAYTEHERERMRQKRKKEKTVAKQVAIQCISLEKLRDCEAWLQKRNPETVAKQVAIYPSNAYEHWAFQGMERLLSYLFWKEGVAKQVGMDNRTAYE